MTPTTPEEQCPECYGKGLAGQDDRPGLLIDPVYGTSECPRCHGKGTIIVTPTTPEKARHNLTQAVGQLLDYAEGIEEGTHEQIEVQRTAIFGAFDSLAAQLEAAQDVIEAARSANTWLQENAEWPRETALDLALARYDAARGES